MGTMKLDPRTEVVSELTEGELKRLSNRHNLLKEPEMVAYPFARDPLENHACLPGI